MVAEKRWIGVIVVIVTASLLMVNACNQKSSEEKMAERALELATGKDVNVKIQGDKAQKVQMEHDGSQTEITTTSTWPAEMITDVPQFTAGKIRRVVKTQEEGGKWTFNIYLADINGEDVTGYAGALKGKGWKTEMMQMGDKGGTLNGKKGTMGIVFMFSVERKDGMLAVFNRP